MDLPNLFTSPQKKPQDQLFICILLGRDTVQSSLWKVEDNQIFVLTTSSYKKFGDDRDCLIQTDESLQELGPDSEDVYQVCLGFDPEFVDEKGLLDSKKPLLKKITKELSIEAVGFVVVSEALSQHMISQDPFLSTLLLYINKDNLYLTLIKQGKVVSSQKVGRSKQITADIQESIARIEKNSSEKQRMPAKIVVSSIELSEEEIQDVQQDLLSFKWSDGLFLQSPLVEVIHKKNLIHLVTEEGGKAVAQSKGLISTKDHQQPEQQLVKKETSSKDADDEDFAVEVTPSNTSPTPTDDNVRASSFGIPVSASYVDKINQKVAQTKKTDKIKQPVRSGKNKGSSFLTKIFKTKSTSTKDNIILPKNNIVPFNNLKKFIYLGAASGILSIIAVYYVYLVNFHKISVIITPQEKIVAKEVDITIDPEIQASNAEKLILRSNLINKELSESDTIETTGTKKVGEKATGSVEILNKTNEVKTFDSGTEFKSGNLVFLLDEQVQVASASVKENDSGDGETKEYGKTEAKVTAKEIGTDGNLGQDTSFTVANYSDSTYLATAKESFTGGASREVRVVAKEDRAKLLDSLTAKLLEKAKDDFDEESGDGRYLVFTGAYQRLSSEFDAEEDSEAEVLSLDVTLEVSAIEYFSDDLKPLAEYILASEIPEGYSLLDQNPEILSQPIDAEDKSDKLILKANMSSKAVARVNVEEIKQELIEYDLDQIVSSLEAKEHIKKVELRIWPIFAKWFASKAPKNIEKIEVIVKE
jgi:hypothetical protein